MNYAIEFPPRRRCRSPRATRRFPVGRIYCVGRNYAEHAREMGHDPEREPPFFFMKPADAIVQNGATIPYPQVTKDLHHEIEMVVAIGKDGADIPVEKALDHVFGYGVGPRHDAPRPPGRSEEDGPAVGDGQGVRQFRAVHRAEDGGDGRAIRPRARSGSR